MSTPKTQAIPTQVCDEPAPMLSMMYQTSRPPFYFVMPDWLEGTDKQLFVSRLMDVYCEAAQRWKLNRDAKVK